MARKVIDDNPCNLFGTYGGFVEYKFDLDSDPLTVHLLWNGEKPLALVRIEHGDDNCAYTDTIIINPNLSHDEGIEVEAFVKDATGFVVGLHIALDTSSFNSFAEAVNKKGGIAFARGSVTKELEQVFPLNSLFD